MQIHDLGDLAKVQFFVVVKAEHGALRFRHAVDGGRNEPLEFAALQKPGE